MTTITALPPAPSRTDPATFSDKSDALLGALDTFVTETNTVAGECVTNAATATTQAGIATTQAGIATTQAGLATSNGAAQVALATTQANNAANSASTATTQAGIATTQAGLATSNGAAQVSLATAQAGIATTQAGIATTQAGIATTKASEANASAIAAAASAASISDGPVTSVNGMTGVVTGLQAALVSGTSIKTINSTSLLGSGDVAVAGLAGNTFTGVQNFIASGYTLKGSSTGKTTFASANSSATDYTITFPASTGTVLTTATAVTVAQGGTGATTLTGIVKGNGTSAFTAATAGTDYVSPTGAETLTNKTIEAGTFTNGYTEETVTANTSTAYTIDLANGTVQILTLTGNCTYTFPANTAGKSFLLVQKQDATGSRTVTWDSDVKWPASTAPTITGTASKADVFAFTCDGTYWYGRVIGQNYL